MKLKAICAVSLATGLLAVSCSSRDDGDSSADDDGDSAAAEESSIDTANCGADPTAEIEGNTIRLASSYPQSGLTAAFAEIARGWKAYFEMVNEEGGVEIDGESYTIEWTDADDEYNAAETAQNIEEMVGADGSGAFAVFSVVGTSNNVAVRDFLGDLCVPDVFAATGSPAWGNPDYPWLMGSSLPPYPLEAEAFVDLLEDEHPDAQIAILRQNDDFGTAYEETIRAAVEGTDMEVVEVATYSAGVNEVSAQITSLAASGADVFFNGGTLLACPDALSKAADANWERDVTWVSGTCLSKTLMGVAGEAGDDAYAVANVMDPVAPQFADEEAMQLYRETVQQHQPDADVENSIVAYGWTQGALFVEALRNAEAPTRLAVMESVRNLDASGVGLQLPDTSIRSEAPDDPFLGEQMQTVQYVFDGDDSHFEPIGEVLDFDGETAELTPEGLITD